MSERWRSADSPKPAEPSGGSPSTYDPNATFPVLDSFAREPDPRKALEGSLNSAVTGTTGRYRIHGPLGEGGMGVVYRAEDTRLRRTVAIKTIPAERVANPRTKERFLNEARTASALDHPNICTIYEIEETSEGQLYLTMPCYDGETLESRLKRGPLQTREAIHLAKQIALGLARAHSRGIIHCDIKPANLMLTTDGVKILDFGIARLSGAENHVQTGPFGTPGYRSPEQARGAELDASSDLWGLGVVLYKMVVGSAPKRDESGETLPWSEQERLSAMHPRGASVELDGIVSRLLAGSRADRYSDAASLLGALDRLEPQSPSPSTELKAIPFKDRSRWISALGGIEIIIALLAAIVTFLYLREGVYFLSIFSTAVTILFCVMGAGSLLVRKWAGTLMLIASSTFLYFGVVLATIFMLSSSGTESSIFFALFFLLIPAVFTLFYSGRNVKATFANRDTKVRWTDRCPAPVLAVVLLFLLASAGSLLWLFALVTKATSVSATIVLSYLGFAGLCGAMAAALYRLKLWAWWVTLGLSIFGFAVRLTSITGYISLVEALRSRPARGGLIALSPGGLFDIFWSQTFVASVVYLLWIKRFFTARTRK